MTITRTDWTAVDRQFWTTAAQQAIDTYIDDHGAEYDRVIDLIQDAEPLGVFAAPEYITAELNDYVGDNIWGDVIYGLTAFDGAATEQLDDHGQSDRFVAAGTTYRYAEQRGEWVTA